MNYYDRQQRSPWISLFTLLGLTLLCAIGIQLIVLLVQILFHIGSINELSEVISINFETNLVFSYTMIIASSLGTFLLPPLILQRIESVSSYLPVKKTGFLLFAIIVVFMISFVPIMQLVAEWNMNMHLPELFRDLEDWMRFKEDEMASLTKSIVMVDSWGVLSLNILAVAVVPAIAEEFYFRGVFMNIMGRMFKNTHVSIWFTAIIFSAIHVQFFGFWPRLLLGAFFGYMLFWTQNIWIPVVGHFINNSTAVIIAFYYMREGKSFEELQSTEVYSTYVYICSFIFSAFVGLYFYKKTKQLNFLDGKGLGKD